ncbi:threonylcarbamoyl-AMP synthase [Flavobacterium silvisoli]|uniref:Threonylcarbamoyl-AMP synthase n=1 Tax=Flavobacterium silvisoli TaxID=2529433 RepID=A0A4V2L4C0_9FLAO|nr:L-threonylcarbamoyladenylate synthase [Flavobacterium silvisoli]TBX66156.1 threonylcarbamoyl-AMP synthase [Flavobacterium silvisoli]
MITTDVNLAAHWLKQEQVIGLPTETVYGLAGNIYSEKAIRTIFDLKKRPLTNPLIVHVGSKAQVSDLAESVPEAATRLMDAFWPGPLTVLLPKKDSVPDLVTAGNDTVALRMPNHPSALELLRVLPFPLAAPSANPFGSISPTTAQHVADYFSEALPVVLEGGSCPNGIESTIVGFEDGKPTVYRLGSIAWEEVEAVAGPLQFKFHDDNKPQAPGMMSKHYAPKTRLLVVDAIEAALEIHRDKKVGLLLFNAQKTSETVAHQEILSVSNNLKEAGANLYAALHRLDALGLDFIIAEKLPSTHLGNSINDRLQRASYV